METLRFKKLLDNHYIVYMTKYHPYYYRYLNAKEVEGYGIEGGRIDNPVKIDKYSWIDIGVNVRNSTIKRSIITTPEGNTSLLVSISDCNLENCEIKCSDSSYIFNSNLEGDFIEADGNTVVLGDSSINGVFQYYNPPYSLTVKESSISGVTRMINVCRNIAIINSNLTGSQNFTPKSDNGKVIKSDFLVIEDVYMAEDGVISLDQINEKKYVSN
jgi:hypothetical protein